MNEKAMPSFGGDNNVAGDQVFGDLDKSQGKTVIEGDMSGDITQTHNYASDPWQEAADYIAEQPDEKDRQVMTDQMNNLKEELAKGAPDEGVIAQITEVIKPYKPYIGIMLKVVKTLVKTTPAAIIAVPVLEAAIDKMK